MRRFAVITNIVLLECYALLLVCLQLPAGVRSDEAMYLLSIPSQHPPLVSSLMAWTARFPLHEFWWRFIFATAVIQCVWLLWDLGSVIPRGKQRTLVATWLLCAAVILQGGTILPVTISAIFGLICIWLVLLPHDYPRAAAPLIGILWCAALFSSIHSILFIPLVFIAMRRTRISNGAAMLYLIVPIALLSLYAAGHPIMLTRIVGYASEESTVASGSQIMKFLWIITLAGGALSLVGAWGIFVSGLKSLWLTTLLICLSIALSPQSYHAILLAPLFCAGLFLLLCRRRIRPELFLPLHLLSTIVLVTIFFPSMSASPARATIRFLGQYDLIGPLLIDGNVGHEWEYESPMPIRRFSTDLSTTVEESATFLICTKSTCEDDLNTDEWTKLRSEPMELWTKNSKLKKAI